jgi:hypothetical protein
VCDEAVMTSELEGLTRTLPGAFERALPLIRRRLFERGLTVTELDIFGEPCPCAVLLADSPELLFEAIALDRAAAVFLPLHIVVSGGGNTSYVHWANPISGFGLRPPAPARAALEELYARVTAALAELPQAAPEEAPPASES